MSVNRLIYFNSGFTILLQLVSIGGTIYCEHGSYISGSSGIEKCCVNCKTWDYYYTYKEENCYDFPNVCKSDSGIFWEPGYQSAVDELSGFSTGSIQCPSEVIVDSDTGMNSTSVPYNFTSEGNKDESCTHPSGTILEIGIHLVICTARDGFTQNILQCSFNVSVIDNEIPNVECPNVTVPTILGKNYANVTYEPDVCDNSGEALEPKCSLAQDSRLSIGPHPVTCNVSDRSLNVNNCSGSVVVQDDESPNVECPNVTVSTILGKNYTNVPYKPDVWDNSGQTLEPKCSLAQESRLSIGPHPVTCNVSDGSLNVNNCSGRVIVQDKEIPHLECPNFNVTTILGENYANVSYEPDVWDNSGEALEPKCSLAQDSGLSIGPQGSRLSIGSHTVTCVVSDRSLNVNNCSGSVHVKENNGGQSKSKNNITEIVVGVLVCVCLIVFGFICCRNKQKTKSKQLGALYNSCTGNVFITMDKKLISVKNHGASFADLSFKDVVNTDYTGVEISWKDKTGHVTKTIEKEDFNRIMTVTDLIPNDNDMFTLTYHSNDGTQEHDNLQLKTHRHLSEIFGKCEFDDITYNSVRVKLQYTKEHLTCKSVFVVIKGVQCDELDNLCNKFKTCNHYSEQKIDAASGIIEYTFIDLRPGHQYKVFVELRSLNPLATVKDPYDLGHVKTKPVSLKDPEVGSNKVTAVFNNLDPDCKPIAFTCCGKPTTTDHCVTIENLQTCTSYTLTYGVIYKGKHLYQGQCIYTTSAEIETCPGATCNENIIDVFDKCLNDVDNLITGRSEERGMLFVERLAKALKFEKPIEALKNESKLGNYKSTFQGLIESRRTCLEMNVRRFLELFEVDTEQLNGFVTGGESESLLTTEKEHLNTFYHLIEKAHNCACCQRYFHSKIHDDTYIKNQLKYHQEST